MRLALFFALAFSFCASSALAVPYRTVVVFGDTQSLVDGGIDPDEAFAQSLADGWDPSDIPPEWEPLRDDKVDYVDFVKMIDWVLANRSSQNIDFVLHVGDIIESGFYGPIHEDCKDGNGGCFLVEPGANCSTHPRDNCPTGCYPHPNPTQDKCRTCDPRNSTLPVDRTEWDDPGQVDADVNL